MEWKNWLKSLVWALIAVAICLGGGLAHFDHQLGDRFYQRNLAGPHEDIVIIGIDSESLEEIGAWGTWSRSVFADVIEILNNSPTGKPAVIGFDIMFSGQTNPEEDQYLAEVAKEAGNVVVASSAKFSAIISNQGEELNPLGVKGYEWPYPALREATIQGHTNVIPDQDGVIRKSLHSLAGENSESRSFAYEVYRKYALDQGIELDTEPKVDDYGRWYIPYSAMPGEYYSGASFLDVLTQKRMPYVKDKIVLIGFYSPGTIDAYFTSVDPSEKMMGVEINANIIQSLMQGNMKYRGLILEQSIFLGMAVFFASELLRRWNIKRGSFVVIGAIGAHFLLADFLYKLDYVMVLVYFPMMLFIMYIIRLVVGYLAERGLRMRVSRRFDQYIIESNIKYSKGIKELLDSLLEVLSTAIDERSVHTSNHTKRIAILMENYVDYMNECHKAGRHNEFFDENRKDQLVMSAWLHDLGKLITPLEVMDKSTRLGNSLEKIEQRWKWIEALERVQYLSGNQDEQDYQDRVSYLKEANQCIHRINTSGWVGAEDIEKVQEIAQQTVTDIDGNEHRWLLDDEVEALSIPKGTLTVEERKIIEQHVSLTKKLLDKIKFPEHLSRVPEIAGNHHELLDGTGYPQGLTGEQLSVEVRMLTIVDMFEALTAKDRPYKKAMPVDVALKIIEEMAELNKLDGGLVEHFREGKVWEKENG